MWKRTKRKAEYIVVCWERLPCGASACRSAWGLAMGDEAFMGDRALAYTRSLHPFPLLRKPLRPRLDGVLSTLAAVAAEPSSMLLVAVRKGSIYDSYSVLFPWEISPRFCYAVITILQPFAAQRGAGRISPRCSRLCLHPESHHQQASEPDHEDFSFKKDPAVAYVSALGLAKCFPYCGFRAGLGRIKGSPSRIPVGKSILPG